MKAEDELREILKDFTKAPISAKEVINGKIEITYPIDVAITQILAWHNKETEKLQEDDHCVESCQEVRSLQAIIDAWHSIFGITQLTHVQARLEVAEEGVKKLQARIKELVKALARICDESYDNEAILIATSALYQIK